MPVPLSRAASASLSDSLILSEISPITYTGDGKVEVLDLGGGVHTLRLVEAKSGNYTLSVKMLPPGMPEEQVGVISALPSYAVSK